MFSTRSLLISGLALTIASPAFAGSHWSYCRQTINDGKSVKTYYSSVFFYDYGGRAGYDPRVARGVGLAFRRLVMEKSGIDPHADPYCFIPLATSETNREQTEAKRSNDTQSPLWSNAVETGWHP